MSDFFSQRDRAYAMTVNRRWGERRSAFGDGKIATSYPEYYVKNLAENNKYVAKGMEAAYASPEGYSIIVNPMTGEKSMFVRGTTFKNAGYEWLQNVYESPLVKVLSTFNPLVGWRRSKSLRRRSAFSARLSKIANAEGVTTVYGHSRGAAVVAHMRGKYGKVGVDGAMLLAGRRKKSMNNFIQRQWFDRAIALGGKNYSVRSSNNPFSRKFHGIYK